MYHLKKNIIFILLLSSSINAGNWHHPFEKNVSQEENENLKQEYLMGIVPFIFITLQNYYQKNNYSFFSSEAWKIFDDCAVQVNDDEYFYLYDEFYIEELYELLKKEKKALCKELKKISKKYAKLAYPDSYEQERRECTIKLFKKFYRKKKFYCKSHYLSFDIKKSREEYIGTGNPKRYEFLTNIPLYINEFRVLLKVINHYEEKYRSMENQK